MKAIKSPYLKVFIVVLLAVLVFNLAGVFSEILSRITTFSEAIEDEYFQAFLLIFSIVFSLIFAKGKLTEYGFKIPKQGFYIRIVLIILIIEIISSIGLSFFTIVGEEHFVADYTFLRTVFSVWLLASISEEIFTRGFIQSYLQSLSNFGLRIKSVFISLPVIVSATLFMSMHIFLIFEDIDNVLFVYVLLSTFVLGIIAGYYREKTGSLLPAILAHMCANIFPFMIDNIVEFL